MRIRSRKALVACGDDSRRARYAAAFLDAGWNVHTVSEGREMLDLLRKQRYGVTLVDDSLTGLSSAEGVLYVRQLTPNRPEVIVAGAGGARRRKLWEKTEVTLNADPEETLRLLPRIISDHEQRCADDR